MKEATDRPLPLPLLLPSPFLHLLELQVEVLHLGLVGLGVLEQREVVLFLLPRRQRPPVFKKSRVLIH